MNHIIAIVQFTGNAKTYEYQCVTVEDATIVKQASAGGAGVCRVVVPGKIKDDGVLSLSIATVVSCRDATEEEARTLNLYPVVKALPAELLDMVKIGVVMIDAAKAAA